MSKLPAFQFYPGDWRKDPGVQALSYHDRGIWFEILMLMHESTPRGMLMLNGVKMPDSALARLLGLDNHILTTSLQTLLEYGVASRCETTGALVCRRMVRDEESRQRAKQAGSTGGNPKLTTKYNAPGFVYAIRDPETGNVKIGIASNYVLRIKKIGYKLGRQMETLCASPVDDMGTKEAQLHSEFASMRVSGEWFKIPDNLISTLKGMIKGTEPERVKGKTRASSSFSPSGENELERSDESPGLPEDLFDTFWKVFPRKVAQGNAQKAWKKAIKICTPEKIIAAAKAYAAFVVGKDKEYVKHPATWLNAKSWNDELPSAPTVCRWPYDGTDIKTEEGMALLTKTFLEGLHRA